MNSETPKQWRLTLPLPALDALQGSEVTITPAGVRGAADAAAGLLQVSGRVKFHCAGCHEACSQSVSWHSSEHE